MRKLVWLGSFTYLLIGLTHIMFGSLLPEILHYYDKSYTDGGLLIAIQSLGLLGGVFFSTYLARTYGRRNTVVLAITLMIVSQIVFVLLLPWTFWLIFAFVCGFGFGIIEPLVGSLIIDSIKVKTAVAFSQLEVFFGIGSLVTPILSGWLATTQYWRFTFLVLACYSAIMCVIWMKASLGQINELLNKPFALKEEKEIKFKSFRPNRLLVGFILFFVIYVGIEVSIMNFFPSMLIDKINADTFASTLSVTLFWAAMVTGRLAAGRLAEHFNYARYLTWSCLGAVVFIVSLGLVSDLWMGYLLIIFVGLTMAGIFGIAMVYANELLDGNTDRNTSLLIASGSIGGIILPIITGGIMDHLSATFVAVVLGFFACYLFFFIIIIKKKYAAYERAFSQ